MRYFLITTIVCIAALAAFMLFKHSSIAVPPKRNPAPSDYGTGISFDDAQKSNKPMVINFYVDWCHTCRAFAPVFDSYRTKYSDKFNFVTVKTDDPENVRIVKYFYIPGYPTVYLVSADKSKKLRVDFEKYFDEKDFKQELDAFLKN